VRRLFNFVKVSLRDGLRWVAQEPHSDELRRAVKYNLIVPFLLGLWRQGAFGSGAPEEVFTVICDATNNPPAEANLGNQGGGLLLSRQAGGDHRHHRRPAGERRDHRRGINREREVGGRTMAELTFKEGYRTHGFALEIAGVRCPVTKVTGLSDGAMDVINQAGFWRLDVRAEDRQQSSSSTT
jgi:hypothetical protein